MSVRQDMTGGIVDRLRSMDVGGAAVLSGHVAASVVRNAASTTLVVAVALALGFRPVGDPLAWLAVAGVLLALVVAVSWLAATIGLVAGSPEAANGFSCRASPSTSRSRRSPRRCEACCSGRPSAARRGPRSSGAAVSIVASAALFQRRTG